MRHGGLLGLIMEDCVKGKNSRRRRQWSGYMQQIMKNQGCNSYEDTNRKTYSREVWKSATNKA